MTNKDVISQYVDTGLQLPEYQVSQLPNWAKKTYTRKRLIAKSSLEGYEFDLLDENEMWGYFMNTIDNNGIISDEVLSGTPQDLVHKLVNYTIDKIAIKINANLFYFSSLDYKQRLMGSDIDRGRSIYPEELRYANDEILNKFVAKECVIFDKYNSWLNLNSSTYKLLTDDLKAQIINTYIKNNKHSIPDYIFDITPKSLQRLFVKSIVHSGRYIDRDFYDDLSDELKFEYINDLVINFRSLHGDQWLDYLPSTHKLEYDRLNNKFNNDK